MSNEPRRECNLSVKKGRSLLSGSPKRGFRLDPTDPLGLTVWLPNSVNKVAADQECITQKG